MKRWIRRVVLYLLLGAVINVAVAWACAWWVPIYGWDLQAEGRSGTEKDDWYLLVYATAGRSYILAEKRDGVLRIMSSNYPSGEELGAVPQAFLPHGPVPSDGMYLRHYSAAGFPCLALSCFADNKADGSLTPHSSLTSRYEFGWSKWDSHIYRVDSFQALPLGPLWGGMIINTLIYAIVSFLALAFLRLLQRKMCVTLRRTLVTFFVICLVFGGVTTVLSAWWFAYYYPNFVDYIAPVSVYGSTQSQNPSTGDSWDHSVSHQLQPGSVQISSDFRPWSGGAPARRDGPAADFLPTWTDFLDPEFGVARMRDAEARGWPMLAMWMAIDIGLTDAGPHWDAPEIHHGILLPQYNDEGTLRVSWSRILPLAPIWPGFLIDTLFYGAVWSVLLFVGVGPRPWRHAIRRRRGRCLDCGYDLQGELDAGCPECGWGREVAG